MVTRIIMMAMDDYDVDYHGGRDYDNDDDDDCNDADG